MKSFRELFDSVSWFNENVREQIHANHVASASEQCQNE